MIEVLNCVELAILIVVQGYDAWSTVTALEDGKREANPVVNWGMGKIGVVPVLVLTKALIISVFTYAVWRYPSEYKLVIAQGLIIVAYIAIFWRHNFIYDRI